MTEDDLAPDEPEDEFPEEHERPLAEHTEETLQAMEAAVQGFELSDERERTESRVRDARERDGQRDGGAG